MPDPEPWSPCPPGELSNLQQSLQHDAKRRARRRLLIAGGAAMVASGCLITIPWNSPQRMTCQEALDLMPAYRADKLASSAQRKQIEAHLAHCPRCRIKYEKNA